MEIHKPKPWHSWREFLKEYLIIVVGVLTALGAEQAVEWLHWKHLEARTEQDLTAGLQPDLLNAVSWLSGEPCFKAWLVPLAGALRQSEANWRAAPLSAPGLQSNGHVLPRVYGMPGFIWSHSAWETALASGALAHLPESRVQQYGEVYRLVELARERVAIAAEISDELSPLAYDRHLSEEERAAYLQRLARLETIRLNMTGSAGIAPRILRGAHQLGIDPPTDQVEARLQEGRRAYGGCASPIKLPLE